MENQKIIDSFNKNSVEEVRISLNKWKNQDYIDIRVWSSLNSDDKDKKSPTKKGITLNVNLIPDLQKALEKAAKELNSGE